MKTIVAVLDDLFFRVKIADAAKRIGLQATFVKTEASLVEHLQQAPAVVVIDLNCATVDPIALAASVKRDFEATPVIGFVSHVQTELRQKAQEAGCDVVLARSVFSTQLPEVLRRYALPCA